MTSTHPLQRLVASLLDAFEELFNVIAEAIAETIEVMIEPLAHLVSIMKRADRDRTQPYNPDDLPAAALDLIERHSSFFRPGDVPLSCLRTTEYEDDLHRHIFRLDVDPDVLDRTDVTPGAIELALQRALGEGGTLPFVIRVERRAPGQTHE